MKKVVLIVSSPSAGGGWLGNTKRRLWVVYVHEKRNSSAGAVAMRIQIGEDSLKTGGIFFVVSARLRSRINGRCRNEKN